MKMNETKIVVSEKETGNEVSKIVQSVGLFLNKHTRHIAAFAMAVMCMSTVAFATGANVADTMWTTLLAEIQKWVIRLGLVVVFYGGIQVGLGFLHQDSAQKVQGWTVVIGGAIITAATYIILSFAT